MKALLTNPHFQKLKDADKMTDILMQKLAEIADNEDISSSLNTINLSPNRYKAKINGNISLNSDLHQLNQVSISNEFMNNMASN